MTNYSVKLLICAGGTGGGVYPALAVLQTLHSKGSLLPERGQMKTAYRQRNEVELSTLWVGGAGGMEAELVKRAGFAYAEIPAAGVHGVGWRRLPGNLLKISQGFLASRKILKQFAPDVVFFTGGYLAVPMAMAARSMKIKGKRPQILLYVPDIEPGLALKTVAKFADQIAVTTETSRQYTTEKAQVKVTGYPTRTEHFSWLHRKEEARKLFGLKSNEPITLVFGGSKGARSINQALLKNLKEMLSITQIIHITGNLDWEQIQTETSAILDSLPAGFPERYRPFPYLHDEMSAALAAADLAVCRAGASVLGELPLFELPAILVPYPYAWRYQRVNAEYLVSNEAAALVRDEELSDRLLPEVRELFRHPERMERMRLAMKKLAKPDAAESIAEMIIQMATEKERQDD